MKEDILRFLPQDHPWADRIQIHDVLPSTNTYAKELARQGAPEGTVVIAGQQTAGRGRLERSFHSPQGTGIYMSLILRPRCPAEQLLHLTCATAVAACDALEQTCGLRPQIKWTNDLTLNGKKLGGILTELVFGSGTNVSAVVIGIGINCRLSRPPVKLKNIACSLSDFTDKTELAPLAAALIAAFEQMSRQFLREQAAIMEAYRRNCITLGRQIKILYPSGTETGIAEQVNDDGSLAVVMENGLRKTVIAGQVSVRGLWDYI